MKKLLARLGFLVPAGVETSGFKRPTRIYLAWCGRHRIYYLDYLHGFDEHVICPLYLAEFLQKD